MFDSREKGRIPCAEGKLKSGNCTNTNPHVSVKIYRGDKETAPTD